MQHSLSVQQIAVEGFDNNFSYLVVDESTHVVGIVDPCGEINAVFDAIKVNAFKPEAILITHSHFDHLDKLDEILKKYPLTVYIHREAQGHVAIGNDYAHYTDHKDIIRIGKGDVGVLHTPGHIADAVCYFISSEQSVDNIPKCITGDTVFVEGCGRTSEQEVEELYKSLQFLKTLPDETEVYPGHDYGSTTVSTIGREKKNNKYFLAKDFEAFRKIRLPQ